ncbi:zinc-binding dehydrogenase [Verrucomicrobiota bacterium]
MKAAIIEDKGIIAVRDVPEPEMGPYGARCEILYGALCTGTDTHLLNRDLPFRNWVRYPCILGHESIGRVVETGENVRHLETGDLVTRVGCPPVGDVDSAWGGFAEQGMATDWRAMQEDGLPKEEWKDKRVNRTLPAGTDPALATMIITWRETYSQLTNLGIGPGKTLAVLGSGSNGLAFAAHGRNMGARTVVLVGSALREPQAERLGVDLFADYKAEDVMTRALTVSAEGFDVVLDAVGNQRNADLGLSLLRDGGTFCAYGVDDVSGIEHRRELARGEFNIQPPGYDEGEVHDEVVALFRDGKLDASIWIDKQHVFTLDEIQAALDAARARTLVKPLIRVCRQASAT